MCNFFSFISDGDNNFYYFNDEQRKKILKKELKKNDWTVENPDSHSSLARFYFKNGAEDSMNKYEFNPITNHFEIDQINTNDDSSLAKDFVMSLDFRSIVKELNVKKIINSLEKECLLVNAHHIELLKKWNSVRNSVCVSVWDSVWDSVGDSVRNSVRNSVRAYISSFFALEKGNWKYCESINFEDGSNPFQSCIDLWNLGLVPSFDGKIWRLHTGPKAKIIFEISKQDLENYKG